MKKIIYRSLLLITTLLTLAGCGDKNLAGNSPLAILFIADELNADLNVTNNPPIIGVVNSDAGLSWVKMYLIKGDVETQVGEVTSFTKTTLHSYSINYKPVYSEDITAFRIEAKDASGQVKRATVNVIVKGFIDAPTITFTPEEIVYNEGTQLPEIQITSASTVGLKSMKIETIVNRTEMEVEMIEGLPENTLTYTYHLEHTLSKFDVGTTGVKVTTVDIYDKVKISIMKVEFIEIPAATVTFDGGDISINEFESATISGKINGTSALISAKYFIEKGSAQIQHGSTMEFGQNNFKYDFSQTISNVSAEVTGFTVEVKDGLDKVTRFTKTIVVKELAPAPEITLTNESKNFNGADVNQALNIKGAVTSRAGITSLKLYKVKRDGTLDGTKIDVSLGSNDKNISINTSVQAALSLGAIIIEAVDVNGKMTDVRIPVTVGFYLFENILASSNPRSKDTPLINSQPGGFISVKKGLATGNPICDINYAFEHQADIIASFVANNTGEFRCGNIFNTGLGYDKWGGQGQNEVVGLDKWTTFTKAPHRLGTNVKRSNFTTVTLTEIQSETLPTSSTGNAPTLAQNNSWNTETGSTLVDGSSVLSVGGKRVIVIMNKFETLGTELPGGYGLSTFRISVIVEK